MFKSTVAAGALAILGTLTILPVGSSQVAATPLMQTGTALSDLQISNTDPNVQTVAYKKWKNKRGWNGGGWNHRWNGGNRWHNSRWGWNQRNHGPRYAYGWGRYRHYHNGYYYASPWWLLAPYALATGAYYGNGGYSGNSHVRYCLSRYRSYDPGSDTFVGYDGYRHRCR